VDQGQR